MIEEESGRNGPYPSPEHIESLMYEALNSVGDRIEKTWSRLRQITIGGGTVLWVLVGIWAASSPSPDDILRAVVVVALSAMIAELVIYRLVPSLLQSFPSTLRGSRKTLLRMAGDAARRVIILHVLYVSALVIVWPSLPLWAGIPLGLIFAFNISVTAATMMKPEEMVLQSLRQQLSQIRRRPHLTTLLFGVLPLVLFGLGAWPYLTGGRAILAIQLGLPLFAMLMGFLHSTYSLAALQSYTEAQSKLSETETLLLVGEISHEEAWMRLTQPPDAEPLRGLDEPE